MEKSLVLRVGKSADEAAAALHRQIGMTAGAAFAQVGLEETAALEGRWEEAQRCFELALEAFTPAAIAPGQAAAWVGLARLDGEIDLQSDGIPGQGTTFRVWLPVDR